MRHKTYLDSAATNGFTSVDEIIINEITYAMKEYWQNPSSLYATEVKDEIDECRKNIADFIGAKPEEIYFTSGSSESNNWAIRGWIDNEWLNDYNYSSVIITTPIEHKSILESVKSPCVNACTKYCDVNKNGIIDYEILEELLRAYHFFPILVSIGMANNEIGTIQDIRRISYLTHEYGGILHVDATQAVGHIPVNVEELGIDMMSVSGHKISPVLKGIGFLYKRNGVAIKPLIYGVQERGLRGSTENTFGIIGLSKAIKWCDVSYETIEDTIELRDYFINKLESKFGCKLNGCLEYRLPNNINVTFSQNITGEALALTLEMSGIMCSVGSACNSHEIKPSHVLKAIGLSDEDAMKSVRFTLSDDITYEDIDYVIEEIDKAIKLISLEGNGEH